MQTFFVYIRRSRCLFISDEHIVKQSRISKLQNNIYKKSIYYIPWFVKNIQYCRIFKEKVWTPWEKLRVKAVTFLTGLPLRSWEVHMYTIPSYNRSVNARITRKFVFKKVLDNQQRLIIWGVSTRAIRVGFPNHLSVIITYILLFFFHDFTYILFYYISYSS